TPTWPTTMFRGGDGNVVDRQYPHPRQNRPLNTWGRNDSIRTRGRPGLFEVAEPTKLIDVAAWHVPVPSRSRKRDPDQDERNPNPMVRPCNSGRAGTPGEPPFPVDCRR